MTAVLLEARPFRPFKSGEEYLIAMKEDLAEWLQTMYPHLNIHSENFMERLETGVALCEHANAVKQQAIEYVEKKQAKKAMTKSVTGSLAQAQNLIKIADVKYFSTAKAGTFFARDNVSNFIKWCRISLEIIECLLFESDDLIMRKNEKHVILCLLEVARRGAKFGMLAPMLVQMERQIDREIAADQKKMSAIFNEGMNNHNGMDDDDSDSDIEDEEPVLMYGPVPQIVTNDLKSLDDMVRDLVEKCTCPTQFPMIRVSEGKYRIGDTKVLIFVRILRNHVMVRVGGGWDTLSHYLDKHDPCRCRSQHRATQSARLVNKPGAADLHGSHIYYERSPQPGAHPPAGALHPPPAAHSLGPPMNALNRSRSRSPSHLYNNERRSISPGPPRKAPQQQLAPPPPPNRSRSPTPNYTSTHLTKLTANNNNKNQKFSNNNNNNNGQQNRQLSPVRPLVQPNSPKLNGNSKLTINNNGNNNIHVASIQIPVDAKVLKAETTLLVNDPLTDHSDTTSEMSDEGYRSLGLVSADKNKQRSSLYSQNSMEEDAEENEHCIDELNDVGLRRTQFSQRIYEEVDGKVATPPSRPPPPVAAAAAKKTTNANKIGTWSGRPKGGRASVTADTYTSPFNRHSVGRRSVSAVGCEVRRSASANTSPTKSRLKQELLNAVKRSDDEAHIVQQVQELLRKYGSVSTLDDGDHYDCKFVRTDDRMSFRSPRKDSRPDNNLSRIPAPVPHKA